MKCFAALLDTRSIQRYIFAGNRLKTNIGASYLVEQIYERELFAVLNSEKYNFEVTYDRSKKTGNEPVAMLTEPNKACEIAYIGGGNALVLFREENIAKEVVADLTKRLLQVAPGLKTGAALGQVELGENSDAYKASVDALYAQLKSNQNTIVPQVSVPYTGLTVECEISGQAASVLYKKDPKKGVRYISAETMAKLQAADAANDKLKAKFGKITDLGYRFVDEIDQLGQKEGDEYIAIVHIDGNNMGAKFSQCENLTQRKLLSNEVAAASLDAFRGLLDSIAMEYDYYEKKELLEKAAYSHRILPIRPIILGGDDITFVCVGKFGVIYAKRYIELLQKHLLTVNGTTVPFSACAGVALLPTSYPFFRGYQLAEQLCEAAKEKSRADELKLEKTPDDKKTDNTTSWLEFGILHGEQAPSLEQIRRQEYTGALGNLHFGPYKVANIGTAESIERLLTGAKEMQQLPSNKVKGLRAVIRKGTNEIQMFLRQLDRLGYRLPVVANKLDVYRNNNLWDKGRTPYLDMIELIDFMYDAEEAGK